MITAVLTLTLQGISFVSIPLFSDKRSRRTQWNKWAATHIPRERSSV